jgi:hypothetical protein
MRAALPLAPFPVFLDVEPDELAAEEAMCRGPKEVLEGAWADYLRRMLPPHRDRSAR